MGEALHIVRRQYEAFQSEDWDAFFALYDPAIEVDLSRSGIPDAGIHHGHDGIREGWTKWPGAWDDYRFEVEELTELTSGGDQTRGHQRHGPAVGTPNACRRCRRARPAVGGRAAS